MTKRVNSPPQKKKRKKKGTVKNRENFVETGLEVICDNQTTLSNHTEVTKLKATNPLIRVKRLPFIRSGQNHLATHSERGKKTRQTEKRWEDKIREWTGLEFAKSQRAVENRAEWRKLVCK